MLAALLISLSVNVVGFGYAVYRKTRRLPSYATLAAERFAPLAGGEVVFAGDSQWVNAPLLTMLTGAVTWAIGGQTVEDITTWIERVAGARRVVLSAGTNDVLLGASPDEIEQRYRCLLAAIPREVDVVIVAVPPLRGHDVEPVNTRLATVAADHHARFLPLPEATRGHTDGVHLSADDYNALAPLLRQVVR